MEDEEGYMAIDPARRSVYTLPPAPQKTEGSVSKVWKIGVTIFLTGSIALNVALIVLLIGRFLLCSALLKGYYLFFSSYVYDDKIRQIENVQNGPNAPTSSNSCEWIPGNTIAADEKTLQRVVNTAQNIMGCSLSSLDIAKDRCLRRAGKILRDDSHPTHVALDPETAHRRLIVSKDGKTVQWGKEEQNLPNNTERFDQRVWVLGKPGFNSGRHCWEVEVKGNGEWAVGVAKQSLRRKGAVDFSTTEGLWAVAEYWGKGNYVAFTAPQPTRLSLGKKPRRIRVFLDYSERLVDFFNPETKVSIYTFSSANFSGQSIHPWFRVWEGTELILRP